MALEGKVAGYGDYSKNVVGDSAHHEGTAGVDVELLVRQKALDVLD